MDAFLFYLCVRKTKMRLRTAIITLFLFIAGFGYSQLSETEKLLNQAYQVVSFSPKESQTITEHILSGNPNDFIKIKTLYISALSLYISGNYDDALNRLFESKKLADKKKNKEYQLKDANLIYRIFQVLELKDQDYTAKLKNKFADNIFSVEDLIEKGNKLCDVNKIDSAVFYADEAKKALGISNSNYSKTLYYGFLADIDFKQRQFNSALSNYKKAIKYAEILDNPFLNESLYHKIADNYLAVDSLQKFQENREISKNFSSISSIIETKASNQAHKLRIEELDEQFITKMAVYKNLIWLFLILTLITLTTKIIFYFRNKNFLKRFSHLVNYLKEREQEKEIKKQKQESIEIEESVKTTQKETSLGHTIPKASSLLKESEEHLLNALEKFESSKKFLNKDMSLGKLAAQLNTNTKYLSEVINRQKEMNFNAYINRLRIDYITTKMKEDPAYLNYKVSYLAEECGYSSHSTFTTVFKSIVGVSPIMFVEFIREGAKQEELTN